MIDRSKIVGFSSDTKHRKQWFTGVSLNEFMNRTKIYQSILSLKWCESFLSYITFLTRCNKIFRSIITILANWQNMVNLKYNSVLDTPTTIATSEIISTKNCETKSKSLALNQIIFCLAFDRAEPLPFTVSNKWLTTKQAITTTLWMIAEPFLSAVGVKAVIRAIESVATSSKILTADYTFNYPILMVFTIHPKYIIA